MRITPNPLTAVTPCTVPIALTTALTSQSNDPDSPNKPTNATTDLPPNHTGPYLRDRV